jgi:hypothetical protein
MENLDFGSAEIGLKIEPPKVVEMKTEEKKDDIQQMNMMEFSSSIDDMLPPPPGIMESTSYVNPTSGRTTALSLQDMMPAEKKKPANKNPFNLTDDQFQAIIAGVVAAIVHSNAVQIKLSTLVPNFNGINGSIASAILVAVVFYFAKNYLMKNQ